jgi:predicted ATPase
MSKKQLIEVAERLREIIPGIRSLSVDGTRELGYLVVAERMKSRGGRRTYDIPAWLLSEGTRRLTAMYALLTATPRPALLAIEEIENGLDPWTLEAVFRDLRGASQSGTQILLTTHSPFLLDHVALKEVIHVHRSDGDTAYTPIESYDDVVKYAGQVPPGAMYLSDYMK